MKVTVVEITYFIDFTSSFTFSCKNHQHICMKAPASSSVIILFLIDSLLMHRTDRYTNDELQKEYLVAICAMYGIYK